MRNPCVDLPEVPLDTMSRKRYPVVTTFEEAKAHLLHGAGVGIDFTGKSPEVIAETIRLLNEVAAGGVRHERAREEAEEDRQINGVCVR